MPLTYLKKALMPDEFVVDEQPLPVHTLEPAAEATAEEDRAPAGFDDFFGAGKGQDLLSQMTGLLMEQVHLAEKARQLELSKKGDDEFGRFVKQVLPFLDNFARLLDLAREHPPSAEVDNWLKNFEALYFRVVHLLESYGLCFINSVGKVVNLDFHDVVDYRMTAEYPDGVVIKEMQKGVVFRDRLMREARVVVACNPNK